VCLSGKVEGCASRVVFTCVLLGGKVVEVVGHSGVDLFDVADSGGAAGGEGEAVVAVELEVDGVFEALPFGVGEEGAPLGVAVGHGFVGPEGLGLWVCYGDEV
jgi:hypothetical protein